METPPKYSYVCGNATFIQYNSSGNGNYNFTDQFYIENLQVDEKGFS